MAKIIIEIANRFIAGETCSNEELTELKNWLSNKSYQHEVNNWLSSNWTNSNEIESNSLIENVIQQINRYEKQNKTYLEFSFSGFLKVYQKIAAFLLIPILGLGIWAGISLFSETEVRYTETFAPRGQKSQIVLADGTKVWLNSDTKIRYPGNFDKKQREIYLDGEAFFEVTKNEKQPFIVKTSGIDIKVLGTNFNVKAYSEEDQIETSLFEGKILIVNEGNVKSEKIETEVNPGQSYLYSKNSNSLSINKFPQDEINGWKKNQLIFKDDTFSNLVRKVERWYNVKIIYDEKLFNDRHLTVELYEGERLELLMDIISLALSVDYIYNKGTIVLTPKSKI